MKLCSGKRRGFSKSVSEIQTLVLVAWFCQICKDCTALSAGSSVALLWHFTQRTVGLPPQAWMKFVPCVQAPLIGLRGRRVMEWSRIASISLMRAASLLRVGRWPLRPVLKHGPRSLTCMQVIGFTKPKGVVKANLRDDLARAQSRRFSMT